MEVELVVIRGPETGRSARLSRFPIVIGREAGCDFVLSDPSVSRRHARIRLDGAELFLENLSGKASLRVNGERIQQGRLPSASRVSLGDSEVRLQLIARLSQPVKTVAERPTKTIQEPIPLSINMDQTDLSVLIHSPDGNSRTVVLSKPEIIFGRDPGCDVPVDDFKMSQRHFCIRRTPHHFHLEDLRSTNGTQIDGQRTSWGPLKNGARISAGRTRFLVQFVPRVASSQVAAAAVADRPKPKCRWEVWPERGLLFSSVGPQPPIGKFLLALARMCPMGLLVDATVRDQIQSPIPADAAPLYHWMDPIVAERASPVWIASDAAIPIVSELAQTNAWVAYFGEGSSEELLARLRKLAHPPELNEDAEAPSPTTKEKSSDPSAVAAPEHPKAISMSQPAILMDMARYGDAGFLNRLLTEFKAAVWEGPEPDAWQAFANETFQKALNSLGFTLSTDEDAQ